MILLKKTNTYYTICDEEKYLKRMGGNKNTPEERIKLLKKYWHTTFHREKWDTITREECRKLVRVQVHKEIMRIKRSRKEKKERKEKRNLFEKVRVMDM